MECLTKQNHDLKRNSNVKRMLGPTVTKKRRRALAPKGGIEKDQKAAMLQVDKSNKIPVVHMS